MDEFLRSVNPVRNGPAFSKFLQDRATTLRSWERNPPFHHVNVTAEQFLDALERTYNNMDRWVPLLTGKSPDATWKQFAMAIRRAVMME